MRRRWLFIPATVAVALAVAVAAFSVVRSQGSSKLSDLGSAELQPSDLPIVYGRQNVRLYQQYTGRMVLNGPTSFQCNNPSNLIPTIWSQGLIRAIYKDDRHYVLECGWLLKTDADARTSFQTSQRDNQRLIGFTSVPSRVGDQSFALTSSLPSSTTYFLLFRHSTALIALQHRSGGTPDLTLAQLIQLGYTTNSRL